LNTRSGICWAGRKKAASIFRRSRASASSGEVWLEVTISMLGNSPRRILTASGNHSNSVPVRNPHDKGRLSRISGPARRFAGRLDLRERPPRMIEKRPTGRCQLDPTRAADQQLDADFGFQVADLPAQ